MGVCTHSIKSTTLVNVGFGLTVIVSEFDKFIAQFVPGNSNDTKFIEISLVAEELIIVASPEVSKIIVSLGFPFILYVNIADEDPDI